MFFSRLFCKTNLVILYEIGKGKKSVYLLDLWVGFFFFSRILHKQKRNISVLWNSFLHVLYR